ncbi:hypothetical protein NWQ33_07375 [Mycoplasmopsis cynos]|nr:hypothetical protein [Mycoplasmopsis cynos]
MFLRKTRWGLRFRSVGENPQAADVAGINVNRVKWQALLIASAVAGIAGSFFAQMKLPFLLIQKISKGLDLLH